MITTRGHGFANFLVDRGMDFDNEWIVFLENGEIWSFLNPEVRLEKNYTYNRKGTEYEKAIESIQDGRISRDEEGKRKWKEAIHERP